MKNIINLPFIRQLHKNLSANTDLLQVILGPRQVGKTTTILEYLATHHHDTHHYVSSDSLFNASPAWLREQWMSAQTKQKLLVIDEIQKCENWAEVLKTLWDESKRHKKPVRCVLLGSSSLSIQKGLTESLTGRFQLMIAHHWNAQESLDGYGLGFDDYLKFGGYPGAYPFAGTDEWRTYVSTSIISTIIEKDILQYHTVKSPALFKQAFEIIMAYPAMEISYTKLLGQLQNKGNVELIKHYLELYQGTYLVKVLDKYSPNRIKSKSSSPKILPLAPCLYYLTKLDQYTPEEQGRVFEAIVGAQLTRTGEDLFYWREGKYEVDYVLRRGKSVWAIEVKSGRRRAADGLGAFIEHYPDAKAVLITRENYSDFEIDPLDYLQATSC
jgi:predicted AAA+ superfamily ATPase